MEVIDWNYAIATLIIRFVGIFVVLGILQVIMQISGRVFARIDQRKAEEGPGRQGSGPSSTMTDEQAAAVATALYLYDKTRH